MRVRISTASGSERDSTCSALATARGTDPASLPIHAIATRSNIWPYSHRSAIIGSTLVARRAGRSAASSATAVSNNEITAKVNGSDAFRDRVGHHAVNAHGGEDERDCAEDREQQGAQPRLRKRRGEQLPHRRDVGDGLFLVYLEHLPAHGGRQAQRVGGRAND